MDPVKLQKKADRLLSLLSNRLTKDMKYEYKLTDGKPRSLSTQEDGVSEELAQAFMGGDDWNPAKNQETRSMTLGVHGKGLRYSGELRPVGPFTVQYIRGHQTDGLVRLLRNQRPHLRRVVRRVTAATEKLRGLPEGHAEAAELFDAALFGIVRTHACRLGWAVECLRSSNARSQINRELPACVAPSRAIVCAGFATRDTG